MTEIVLLAWSSGKDSAFALHTLRQSEGVEVVGLLTTVNGGEFHSFAWDGPAFAHPVPVQVGEVVERDGFVFADLLPALTTEKRGGRVGRKSHDEEARS